MDMLQILAVVLQLVDAGNTCYSVKHGMHEANPVIVKLFSAKPSCTQMFAFKGAILAPMFILPKGKFKTAITIGNIGSGGIGVSVSLYNRSRK